MFRGQKLEVWQSAKSMIECDKRVSECDKVQLSANNAKKILSITNASTIYLQVSIYIGPTILYWVLQVLTLASGTYPGANHIAP